MTNAAIIVYLLLMNCLNRFSSSLIQHRAGKIVNRRLIRRYSSVTECVSVPLQPTRLLTDEAELEQIGSSLSKVVHAGDVILLTGTSLRCFIPDIHLAYTILCYCYKAIWELERQLWLEALSERSAMITQ
jgi:hypothetical protein